MAISHMQTVNTQMRRVLGTCLHHDGVGLFDIADVHERTLLEMSRRGWCTTTVIQDRADWRYMPSAPTVRHLVTVGYRVTLTREGMARAEALKLAQGG